MPDPLLLPETVKATRERLSPWIVKTPLFAWHTPEMRQLLGEDTHVEIKLELFQNTNSFKPRGALNVMLNADEAQLRNGVVAISGGNHGIATSYAAKVLGHHAKIIFLRNASPLRRQRCEYYGAEVILCDDFKHGLKILQTVQKEEGRVFVHPYEGPYTAQGTATVASEWDAQTSAPLDVVIIPIGGGGLIAGMASYFKQIWPKIKIYGVEPEGAPTIYNSLQAGRPLELEKTNTIADSLSPPWAMPYSFGLIQQYVDEVVLLSDDAMRAGMHFLFTEMKLVAEPACAAATAGLLGPFAERCRGQRVGVIACGSNLDIASFAKEVFRAEML